MESDFIVVSVATPNNGGDPSYVIDDPVLGESFQVRVSKEGRPPWWKDMGKLQRFIFGLKCDMNITEACIYVGISYDQYRQFKSVHPEFSQVEERCSHVYSVIAHVTVGEGLKKNANLAFKFLQGTRPDRYKRTFVPEPVKTCFGDFYPNGVSSEAGTLFINVHDQVGIKDSAEVNYVLAREEASGR